MQTLAASITFLKWFNETKAKRGKKIDYQMSEASPRLTDSESIIYDKLCRRCDPDTMSSLCVIDSHVRMHLGYCLNSKNAFSFHLDRDCGVRAPCTVHTAAEGKSETMSKVKLRQLNSSRHLNCFSVTRRLLFSVLAVCSSVAVVRAWVWLCVWRVCLCKRLTHCKSPPEHVQKPQLACDAKWIGICRLAANYIVISNVLWISKKG